MFLQAGLVNIFNGDGVVSYDEQILTNHTVDALAPFNPFTDTPIGCRRALRPTCARRWARTGRRVRTSPC